MRVMITGGTGFVGLAVAEAVLAQGDTAILVADRPAPPAYLAALGGDIVWHQADLRDAAAPAAAFAATRPTHVVHGAALTPAPEQERAAADALIAVNIGGTAQLLQAAAGVARVVMLSSVAAYGPAPPDQRLTEDRPPAPATLYGISKFAAEMVARRLATLLGLDLVIARLGPVFGPFEYETGVRGLMSPHLQMLRQAMAGTPSVLPWGLAADWIFSRDVAAGVVTLLRAQLAAGPRLFNLGSGAVTDLPGWAAAIAPHFPGWSWRIGEAPTIRYGLTEARAPMDTARLAAAGFRPRHDLADAAAASVAWYRRHAA